MFVHYLNERQQGALLHYAHEMMRVDGSIAGEELALLDLLRDQAQPGVEAEDVPLEARRLGIRMSPSGREIWSATIAITTSSWTIAISLRPSASLEVDRTATLLFGC